MNERKAVRTPVHGLMDWRRGGRFPDDAVLPVSEFEARRPLPDVRPAAQDARDAIRRSSTRG